MDIVIIILLLLLLFGGGGSFYMFGPPGILGVLFLVLVIYLVLKLLGHA